MISRKILILGCLLNCQSVWAGCADAGRDANRTGEYDNAIKIFTACLADRSANRSLLFFGRGVSYHGKRQYDRAVQDYTSSIELDSSTAGVYLFRGMCYYSKGQYNLAAQDYRIAASQGDADAQYKLGWAYTTGEGVPKDGKESVKWFRLAADQGYADAQFSLGQLHTLGRGVPVDEKEAVRWYRLAAGQGLAHAQFQLGAMYATGKGVPEDDMEAVKWY